MTFSETLAKRLVPKYFGISMTQYCNVACSHCISSSGPHLPLVTIHPDYVRAMIKVFKHMNPQISMVVTGGEPFSDRRKLLELVKIAGNKGVRSAIHSNGYWGSKIWAADTLHDLKRNGTYLITLSFDEFHIHQLGLDNVSKAARLVLDSGLNLRIETIFKAGRAALKNEIFELLKLEDSSEQIDFAANYVEQIGQAINLPLKNFRRKSINEFTDQPCRAVLNPIVFEDGLVSACCGSALTRHFWSASPDKYVRYIDLKAPVQSLRRIVQEWYADPFLVALANEGPASLLAKLESTESCSMPSIENGDICSICRSLVFKQLEMKSTENGTGGKYV